MAAPTKAKKKVARKKATLEQVRFTHPEFTGQFTFPSFARIPSLLMDDFYEFATLVDGDGELTEEQGIEAMRVTNKLIRFCAKHTTDPDTREVLEELSSEEFMAELLPKWQEASSVDASKSVPAPKPEKEA